MVFSIAFNPYGVNTFIQALSLGCQVAQLNQPEAERNWLTPARPAETQCQVHGMPFNRCA